MNRTTALCSAALLCAALIPSSASAQIKKSGSGYLLRLKLTKGQAIKHKLTTVVSGLPKETQTSVIKNGVMKLTGNLVEVVQSVTGGVATVAYTLGPLRIPGQGAEVLPAQSSTGRINELGDPVGDEKGSGFSAHFPKAAVKIGESWNSTVPMTGMGAGRSQASAKFTFKGIQKVKGKQLGVLGISILPSQQVKGGGGTMYLNPANGLMISGTLNIEMNNPQAGSAGPVKVSIQIAPG